jgi:hypothetical protein
MGDRGVRTYQFQPQNYGPSVAALLAESELMPLGPGCPRLAVQPRLEALSVTKICMAGLWLYFNFLDQSHIISQNIHTPEGSFWHAIMHRREPDAWNSKYWWQRVREHPVLDQLRYWAPTIGYQFTTPVEFVDFCERVRDTGSSDEVLAQQVQLLEWQLLFDYCYRLTDQ